jgi:hypothetical protein
MLSLGITGHVASVGTVSGGHFSPPGSGGDVSTGHVASVGTVSGGRFSPPRSGGDVSTGHVASVGTVSGGHFSPPRSGGEVDPEVRTTCQGGDRHRIASAGNVSRRSCPRCSVHRANGRARPVVHVADESVQASIVAPIRLDGYERHRVVSRNSSHRGFRTGCDSETVWNFDVSGVVLVAA